MYFKKYPVRKPESGCQKADHELSSANTVLVSME
jgi:hypothetical protein